MAADWLALQPRLQRTIAAPKLQLVGQLCGRQLRQPAGQCLRLARGGFHARPLSGIAAVLCQLQTAVGQRSLPLLQQDLRLLDLLLQCLQAAVQLLLLPVYLWGLPGVPSLQGVPAASA